MWSAVVRVCTHTSAYWLAWLTPLTHTIVGCTNTGRESGSHREEEVSLTRREQPQMPRTHMPAARRPMQLRRSLQVGSKLSAYWTAGALGSTYSTCVKIWVVRANTG